MLRRRFRLTACGARCYGSVMRTPNVHTDGPPPFSLKPRHERLRAWAAYAECQVETMRHNPGATIEAETDIGRDDLALLAEAGAIRPTARGATTYVVHRPWLLRNLVTGVAVIPDDVHCPRCGGVVVVGPSDLYGRGPVACDYDAHCGDHCDESAPWAHGRTRDAALKAYRREIDGWDG